MPLYVAHPNACVARCGVLHTFTIAVTGFWLCFNFVQLMQFLAPLSLLLLLLMLLLSVIPLQPVFRVLASTLSALQSVWLLFAFALPKVRILQLVFSSFTACNIEILIGMTIKLSLNSALDAGGACGEDFCHIHLDKIIIIHHFILNSVSILILNLPRSMQHPEGNVEDPITYMYVHINNLREELSLTYKLVERVQVLVCKTYLKRYLYEIRHSLLSPTVLLSSKKSLRSDYYII